MTWPLVNSWGDAMDEQKPELAIVDKEQAAFQQSAIQVIKRARETGTPVIVWENNQIMKLSPDEAERRLRSSQKEVITESN